MNAEDQLAALTMPEHKCEKVAEALMEGDRELWIGRLLEPISGYPKETHCLHFRTPLKSVVFGIWEADMQWMAALGMAVYGPINPEWLARVAESSKKRASFQKERGAAQARGEHIASEACWCNPTRDSDEPSVLIHHEAS